MGPFNVEPTQKMRSFSEILQPQAMYSFPIEMFHGVAYSPFKEIKHSKQVEMIILIFFITFPT